MNGPNTLCCRLEEGKFWENSTCYKVTVRLVFYPKNSFWHFSKVPQSANSATTSETLDSEFSFSFTTPLLKIEKFVHSHGNEIFSYNPYFLLTTNQLIDQSLILRAIKSSVNGKEFAGFRLINRR